MRPSHCCFKFYIKILEDLLPYIISVLEIKRYYCSYLSSCRELKVIEVLNFMKIGLVLKTLAGVTRQHGGPISLFSSLNNGR